MKFWNNLNDINEIINETKQLSRENCLRSFLHYRRTSFGVLHWPRYSSSPSLEFYMSPKFYLKIKYINYFSQSKYSTYSPLKTEKRFRFLIKISMKFSREIDDHLNLPNWKLRLKTKFRQICIITTVTVWKIRISRIVKIIWGRDE